MATVPASPGLPTGDPQALIGAELGGSYVVVRLIGAGGMGSVYEAKHVRLPRQFAIKVLAPEIAQDEVWLARFRREAESASALRNANIVEVVDFNLLPDGAPYMVMEYLDGEDLSDRIEKRGKLSPRYAASVIADAASGLASAHAHGIVHRDIKPPNIFLARREREPELVKVLDFGAAKVRKSAAGPLTLVGQTMGTPWYMSPEQARGQELDARSDQFSLAVVLYAALTGRLPFEANDVLQAMHQIVRDPGTRIAEFEPQLPKELQPVLDRAMAKKAVDRFPSVEEFAARVSAVLDDGSAGRPSPKALTVRLDPVAVAPTPEPPARTVAEPPVAKTGEAGRDEAPLVAEPKGEGARSSLSGRTVAIAAGFVVLAGLLARWVREPVVAPVEAKSERGRQSRPPPFPEIPLRAAAVTQSPAVKTPGVDASTVDAGGAPRVEAPLRPPAPDGELQPSSGAPPHRPPTRTQRTGLIETLP